MMVSSVLRVVLVDLNPKVVRAWRQAFADKPEVEIVQGSILEQQVDAWVSPTNSQGSMDGGVDAAIRKHLGAGIQRAVKAAIAKEYGGSMPVGCAVCVPTKTQKPRFLISTPTMVESSEDIGDRLNVALACAAAFQAIHMQNAREPGGITSVALPGLGAGTGQVPVNICADLMWTGYGLFNDCQFRDYDTLRPALQEMVGTLPPEAPEARVRIKPGWVSNVINTVKEHFV